MQAEVRQERTRQVERLARLVVLEPFQQRSRAELGYLIVSSGLSLGAAFALGLIALAGAPLTVVGVGVLVLAGGLRAARGLGHWQRRLARRMLGEDIADPTPFGARPGFVGWLRACFGDWAAWRAVAYVVAKVPLTFFGIWFALSTWVEALLGIASPLVGGAGPARFGAFRHWLAPGAAGGSTVETFVAGIALLLVAPWATRLVVELDRRMVQLLLGPDAAASRVRSLEESRSKTLDAATATLRRIERDLHDGTQAQLVALAMRLGQAREGLASIRAAGGGAPEIDAIQRLVDEAHRGAKEAITDLRDLARGIHPPALDTGLANALATLAARSTVPTEVTVAIDDRPGPAIEAICYFSAAELLANVAQHAGASRASLSCVQHGRWLRLVVRDDGRGGAAINRIGSTSSGLAGLADRVGAVDGHLSCASPPGGPTAVTVDLPSRG